MTQIFIPPNLNTNTDHLYCYTNHTSKVAIARVIGLTDRRCERVVFPGEHFLFRAESNCNLEISQYSTTGIIQDTIPCHQLKVNKPISSNLSNSKQ